MLHRGLVAELIVNTNTSGYLAGDSPGYHRVFPLVIPQKIKGGSAQMPCVVYDVRSVERQVTYCGTSGLVRSVMNIDCYALSYDESKELAQAVRDALLDYRGLLGGIVDVRAASLETEFDIQDIEPGLYRVSQSWVFWHAE